MPLDSLFHLMETLRERIQQHRDLLQKNEMLTRYVLVDPLLRELGWDTENPNQVRPEFRPGQGAADYALMSNGKPVMMVEAKKLGTPLSEGLMQSINYCLQDGTPYFAVTDGQRWQVFETHKPVPIDEKRVVEFDVADSKPSNAALRALALWRNSVQTGVIESAQPPLVEVAIEPPTQPSPTATVASTPTAPAASTEWVPVAQLQPGWHAKAPKLVRFPDGKQVPIKYWVDLTLQVTKWLVDQGLLTSQHCPIQYAKRYVVAATAVHPNGNPFKEARQIGAVHVEANYSGGDQCRNTRLILQHVGQDPDQFLVRF